jgi:hypothetical protein
MVNGHFSFALAQARDRLDQVSRARFGVPAARLPSTRWGTRRLPAGDRSTALALRRLNSRAERLEALTLRRESGIWLRWDFWRSHTELLSRFRARLAPLLSDVGRATGARPA